MRAWPALLGLLLAGCPQVDETVGACPCSTGYVCCEASGQCLPEGEPCPAFDAAPAPDARYIDRGPPPDLGPDVGRPPQPAEVAVVEQRPLAGDPAGGDTLRVRLAPVPQAVLSVHVGAQDCPLSAALDADGWVACTVPPGPPGVDRVAVTVTAKLADGGVVVGQPGDWRYEVPLFRDDSAWAGVARAGAGPGVLVGDLDGDGALDLRLPGPASEAPRAFAGRGGWFEAVDGPVEPTGLSGLLWGDFNTDGAPDLLAAGAGLALYPGEQGAITQQTTRVGLGVLPDEVLRAVVFDLNGDGEPDVVGARSQHQVARPDPARALVVALAKRGDLGEVAERLDRSLALDTDLGEVRAVAPIDFDADGDVDVLVCADRLWLLRNDRGTLADATGLLPRADRPCGGVAALDLDLDGWTDLAWTVDTPWGEAAGLMAEQGVWLLRNDAGARFERFPDQRPARLTRDRCLGRLAGTATVAIGRGALAAFDADHDGDEDLFVPTPYGPCAGHTQWLESRAAQGEVTLVPHPVLRDWPTAEATGVLPVDLDGDGDLDVLHSAEAPGDRARLYRNLHAERGGGPPDWLSVTVKDAQGRTAWGAVVELSLPRQATRRRVLVSASNAQGPGAVHFGVGDAAPPYVLTVTLPDGTRLEHTAAAAGVVAVRP